MATQTFIDSLRYASRMLPPPTVKSDRGEEFDANLARHLNLSDLWLTVKSVAGYDPDDFSSLPINERERLDESVAVFRRIAEEVGPSGRPRDEQSYQARKSLEQAIEIVRKPIIAEWLEAQRKILDQAIAASTEQGWHTRESEKKVNESLLGNYLAPRLQIRTPETEVVLDPIARYGTGQRGVIDLVVMPAFETAFTLAYKNGLWQILSKNSEVAEPFSKANLVRSIESVGHR